VIVDGTMEFRILGPLEAVDGSGRPLRFGGAKQRALLTALLLTPNRAVSADRLTDALWPGGSSRAGANALQYHVSQLRKLLGEEGAIVTDELGYAIRIDTGQIDLFRFERLVCEAEEGDAATARRLLVEALGLWRGDPLPDLADDPSARAEIERLRAARLAALELRMEADLALGRHAQLVPELRVLVHEHPLHERFAAALMRTLYAGGRQADALEVYRATRQRFVDELGMEPSPALRDLEQAILRHDPGLDRRFELDSGFDPGADPRANPASARRVERRSIIVLVGDERRLADLVDLAAPLATRPPRELILAQLVSGEAELAPAVASLAAQRERLAGRGVEARVAAYTASEAEVGGEAVRLAGEHDADLIVAEAPATLAAGALGEPAATLLERAPCDVGLLTVGVGAAGGPVVTPFGGADHDWSAIELAAWLAASLGTGLRLLGTQADPALGRRDASRLLARASLLVQQVVGIVTEPVFIEPGEDGVVTAAAGARVLVIGLSERWRTEGIGPIRLAISAAAEAPVLFVRHGSRDSELGPMPTFTRFTWTRGAPSATPGPASAPRDVEAPIT
jgi:DNA-binding SARP family transcriptional activator